MKQRYQVTNSVIAETPSDRVVSILLLNFNTNPNITQPLLAQVNQILNASKVKNFYWPSSDLPRQQTTLSTRTKLLPLIRTTRMAASPSSPMATYYNLEMEQLKTPGKLLIWKQDFGDSCVISSIDDLTSYHLNPSQPSFHRNKKRPAFHFPRKKKTALATWHYAKS